MTKLNLTDIRKKLEASPEKPVWRCLEELAETEEFREFLHEEFPRQASLADTLKRRDFLKLLGAALGMAGLTACAPTSAERVLPYVDPPELVKPGEPVYYATTYEHAGYGLGVIVESREGRPVKLEGNPNHPASLGATDLFSQASVFALYDPDRAKVITSGGRIRTRDEFTNSLNDAIQSHAANEGDGLRILTGTITSPTLISQIQSFLEAYPQAAWHSYEPAVDDLSLAGMQAAFGRFAQPVYRVDQANVILSLDSDFLYRGPGSVRYAHDFGARRRPLAGETEVMNRLYVVESSPTVTGGSADHRIVIRASQVEHFARALAQRLGIEAVSLGPDPVPGEEWLDALAADLSANRGRSLIVAGQGQPPAVHAIAHALNQEMGNTGSTVVYIDPVSGNPGFQVLSLASLAQDLNNGLVRSLIIIDGDPVFTAPADISFADALQQAEYSVYLGLYANQTANACQWHVPSRHYLEMWSDSRAYDGTASLVQPLIEPLYSGMSAHELLALMSGSDPSNGYDIVRNYWQMAWGLEGDAFESAWREALREGIIPNSASAPVDLPLREDFSSNLDAPSVVPGEDNLELVFAPDPSIWDGRYANNAWLQELPKPISSLTWDNAALISPALAERIDLTNEEVVEISFQERTLSIPVLILPGQADNTLLLPFGYGSSQGGSVLEGTGFNVYTIRTASNPWIAAGAQIRKTGQRYTLARTQGHHSMEGRDLVRTGSLAEFEENPDMFGDGGVEGVLGEQPPPSLYPEYSYDEGYSWGMTINLSACNGCNACVMACSAENNVPVVGKAEVENSREMHWLRIDSYFEGNLDTPDISFQPVLCMHCEKAPCEPVCPTAATVHSPEGLNEMVYSRCVGTRYCSNNCPYKVRRFNFFQYSEFEVPLALAHNPEVTVRDRGVMEKCTYCVQRIQNARIQAQVEGRVLEDGEVMTACQQACPTRAIVFGNINDPDSEVRRLKDQPHNYGLLAELGTQPRTSYLAKLRNENRQA